MSAITDLQQIRDEIWNLKKSPLYKYRTQNKYYPVIGEGNHNAAIIFIGEAPGEKEALSGRPFAGAAGRIFDELLTSIKLDRKDVYVSNLVKDRPPGNRDPKPEEIALYGPFLEQQIKIIKPKVIVSLGRYSLQYLLTHFNRPEAGQTISKLHGKPLDIKTDYGKAVLLPLYHPAVALYSSSQKPTLLEDFKVLKKFIKK
jgi:uracil-DNA glycosylase